MNATLTKNRNLKHVNLYRLGRAYRGNKEDGWWYPTGTFISCLGKTLDPVAAALVREAHQEELDTLNEGRPAGASDVSTSWYDIYIQEYPGESYPKFRPYYE